MEQQHQPQSRRGRKPKAQEEAPQECPMPQPECPLPSPKKDDLPPGMRRKALPDGGYMVVKDNFKKEKGSY